MLEFLVHTTIWCVETFLKDHCAFIREIILYIFFNL